MRTSNFDTCQKRICILSQNITFLPSSESTRRIKNKKKTSFNINNKYILLFSTNFSKQNRTKKWGIVSIKVALKTAAENAKN